MPISIETAAEVLAEFGIKNDEMTHLLATMVDLDVLADYYFRDDLPSVQEVIAGLATAERT